MGRKIALSVISNYHDAKKLDGDKISFANKSVMVKSNQGTESEVADALQTVKMYTEKSPETDEKFQELKKVVPMYVPKAMRIALNIDREEKELYLSALSVGDVVFAGYPGEPFTELGRYVKDNSKYKLTFISCCANGYEGYLPTSDAYEGRYESDSAYYIQGSGEKLAQELTELIHTLSGLIYMKISNSHDYIREKAKSITPSMRYDKSEDFFKWREAAKEKLADLLMLPNEHCEDMFNIISEKQFDGYKRIDFEFQSEPGYFVSSSFLIPESRKGKTPTVICIQGHSTGMHISLGEAIYDGDAASIAGGRDFALRTVSEGFCAVTIEQRYMGSAGHNEDGQPACLSNNEGMSTLLLGRTAIGERVWDISRLIDVIIKHFSEYVDTDRIVCLGNSGGGTATFYASCLDERIFLSVPSCSVCTFEESIMAMWHCPCNFIPGIRKYFDMGDLGCLIAPRKLIVVCGIEDDIFPIDGVEKSYEIIKNAYEHIGKSKNCRLVKGNGGHQFYPDDAWSVIHEYLK